MDQEIGEPWRSPFHRFPRHVPRLGVNIVDQAFSSGTNFIATLVAARMLGPDEFGPVVLAFSIAFLAMTFQRAVVGEPMMAVLAPMPSDKLRRNSWAGVSSALVMGLAIGAVCAAVGTTPFRLTSACLPIAAFIPVLLVQDGLRYLAFAARRPGLALRSDAAWLIVEAGVLALLVVQREHSAVWFVVAWGSGAVAGAIFAPWRLVAPRMRLPVLHWLRLTRRLAPWLFVQSVAAQGTLQVIVFIVGGILGSAALGGFRAMQTLLQPVLTATVALIAFLVPRYARALTSRGPDAITAGVRRWAALAATGAIPFAVGVSLVAPWLVRLVYGNRYSDFDYLIPIFATAVFLQAVAIPPSAALRAMLDGRRLLIGQLASSGCGLVTVPIAATLWGLGAVAGAYALSSGVLLAVTWYLFNRATSTSGHSQTGPASSADSASRNTVTPPVTQ